MNLFYALEMFFWGKDGKSVIGAKIKVVLVCFCFQKSSQSFRNTAYQNMLKPSTFSLNFFCKIDAFKVYVA